MRNQTRFASIGSDLVPQTINHKVYNLSHEVYMEKTLLNQVGFRFRLTLSQTQPPDLRLSSLMIL